ncbi:hypothetical protein [Spirosoma horti]
MMIKVFLAGSTDELFQLNMNPTPSIGDELLLLDQPYVVTARRHVLQETGEDVMFCDYTILFVRRIWQP